MTETYEEPIDREVSIPTGGAPIGARVGNQTVRVPLRWRVMRMELQKLAAEDGGDAEDIEVWGVEGERLTPDELRGRRVAVSRLIPLPGEVAALDGSADEEQRNKYWTYHTTEEPSTLASLADPLAVRREPTRASAREDLDAEDASLRAEQADREAALDALPLEERTLEVGVRPRIWRDVTRAVLPWFADVAARMTWSARFVPHGDDPTAPKQWVQLQLQPPQSLRLASCQVVPWAVEARGDLDLGQAFLAPRQGIALAAGPEEEVARTPTIMSDTTQRLASWPSGPDATALGVRFLEDCAADTRAIDTRVTERRDGLDVHAIARWRLLLDSAFTLVVDWWGPSTRTRREGLTIVEREVGGERWRFELDDPRTEPLPDRPDVSCTRRSARAFRLDGGEVLQRSACHRRAEAPGLSYAALETEDHVNGRRLRRWELREMKTPGAEWWVESGDRTLDAAGKQLSGTVRSERYAIEDRVEVEGRLQRRRVRRECLVTVVAPAATDAQDEVHDEELIQEETDRDEQVLRYRVRTAATSNGIAQPPVERQVVRASGTSRTTTAFVDPIPRPPSLDVGQTLGAAYDLEWSAEALAGTPGVAQPRFRVGSYALDARVIDWTHPRIEARDAAGVPDATREADVGRGEVAKFTVGPLTGASSWSRGNEHGLDTVLWRHGLTRQEGAALGALRLEELGLPMGFMVPDEETGQENMVGGWDPARVSAVVVRPAGAWTAAVLPGSTVECLHPELHPDRAPKEPLYLRVRVVQRSKVGTHWLLRARLRDLGPPTANAPAGPTTWTRERQEWFATRAAATKRREDALEGHRAGLAPELAHLAARPITARDLFLANYELLRPLLEASLEEQERQVAKRRREVEEARLKGADDEALAAAVAALDAAESAAERPLERLPFVPAGARLRVPKVLVDRLVPYAVAPKLRLVLRPFGGQSLTAADIPECVCLLGFLRGTAQEDAPVTDPIALFTRADERIGFSARFVRKDDRAWFAVPRDARRDGRPHPLRGCLIWTGALTITDNLQTPQESKALLEFVDSWGGKRAASEAASLSRSQTILRDLDEARRTSVELARDRHERTVCTKDGVKTYEMRGVPCAPYRARFLEVFAGCFDPRFFREVRGRSIKADQSTTETHRFPIPLDYTTVWKPRVQRKSQERIDVFENGGDWKPFRIRIGGGNYWARAGLADVSSWPLKRHTDVDAQDLPEDDLVSELIDERNVYGHVDRYDMFLRSMLFLEWRLEARNLYWKYSWAPRGPERARNNTYWDPEFNTMPEDPPGRTNPLGGPNGFFNRAIKHFLTLVARVENYDNRADWEDLDPSSSPIHACLRVPVAGPDGLPVRLLPLDIVNALGVLGSRALAPGMFMHDTKAYAEEEEKRAKAAAETLAAVIDEQRRKEFPEKFAADLKKARERAMASLGTAVAFKGIQVIMFLLSKTLLKDRLHPEFFDPNNAFWRAVLDATQLVSEDLDGLEYMNGYQGAVPPETEDTSGGANVSFDPMDLRSTFAKLVQSALFESEPFRTDEERKTLEREREEQKTFDDEVKKIDEERRALAQEERSYRIAPAYVQRPRKDIDAQQAKFEARRKALEEREQKAQQARPRGPDEVAHGMWREAGRAEDRVVEQARLCRTYDENKRKVRRELVQDESKGNERKAELETKLAALEEGERRELARLKELHTKEQDARLAYKRAREAQEAGKVKTELRPLMGAGFEYEPVQSLCRAYLMVGAQLSVKRSWPFFWSIFKFTFTMSLTLEGRLLAGWLWRDTMLALRHLRKEVRRIEMVQAALVAGGRSLTDQDYESRRLLIINNAAEGAGALDLRLFEALRTQLVRELAPGDPPTLDFQEPLLRVDGETYVNPLRRLTTRQDLDDLLKEGSPLRYLLVTSEAWARWGELTGRADPVADSELKRAVTVQFVDPPGTREPAPERGVSPLEVLRKRGVFIVGTVTATPGCSLKISPVTDISDDIKGAGAGDLAALAKVLDFVNASATGAVDLPFQLKAERTTEGECKLSANISIRVTATFKALGMEFPCVVFQATLIEAAWPFDPLRPWEIFEATPQLKDFYDYPVIIFDAARRFARPT